MKKNRSESSYFKSIYFTFALVTCGSTILFIMLIGNLVEKKGTEILTEISANQLVQMSAPTKYLSDTGRNLAIEIFSDREIIPILYAGENEVSANKITVALNRINTYRNSNSFVHSIMVYNSMSQAVYSTFSEGKKQVDEFLDEEIAQYFKGEIELDLSHPISRVVKDSSWDEMYTEVYTFIYEEQNRETGKIEYAVAINIDQKWLQILVDDVADFDEGWMYIIDNKGDIVSKLSESSEKETPQYLNKLIAQKSDKGYFVEEVDDKKKLISYLKVDEFSDWIFVKENNYKQVTAPLHNLQYVFILLTAIACICLSILIYWISKKVYKPIQTLEIDFSKLKSEARKSGQEMKNTMLQNLVTGNILLSNSKLEEKFTNYKFPLITGEATRIILLQIDNEKLFYEKYHAEDRDLIRFAITNICNELINSEFQGVSVVMQNEMIALIIQSQEIGCVEQDIEKLIESIQENILRYSGVTITAVLTEEIEDIAMIDDLYRNALSAMRYRIFNDNGSIIHINEIEKLERKKIIYPKKQTELVLMNLKAGNIDEAKEKLRELLEQTSKNTYRMFMGVVYHMASSVYSMMNDYEISVDILSGIGGTNIMKSLEGAENMEEIEATFFLIFDQLGKSFGFLEEEKKSRESGDLVKRICVIVEENYSDINICIQSISEVMDMSPAYVGRMFKKKMKISITEYVTEKRMEKATKMLMQSDTSINEISDVCGFSNITYFYRVFKKKHGVTPNIYRISNHE